jgi:putative CocE/NonD family hydrolase
VDDWWHSLEVDLDAIEVPALICGSFSDNNRHGRSSIEGFERISSPDKHLWTHRAGRWETYYGDEALAAQLQFFDRHLCRRNVPPLPRVRLEVRESRDVVTEVRTESAWPLPDTTWTPLHLTGDGLAPAAPGDPGSISFAARRHGVRFDWTVPADTEITGPVALRLAVELDGTDDACLVAGIEKWRGGDYVPFEGSYGFGRDRIGTGWQRVALRGLDPVRSRPFAPWPLCTSEQPVGPGEIVAVEFGLGNSATLFRAGETLRLVVAARWLWPRNPFTGQFPAAYATRPKGTVTLHWGAGHRASLLVPIV